MAEKKFTVLDLLDLELSGHDALNLKCIAGRRGLPRAITIPEINRPGLALSGFYESFASNRVQLFGRGETAYLQKLHKEKTSDALQTFFSSDIPCCVFTYNLEPTEEFRQMAEENCCPILQTDLPSTDFSNRINRVFSNIFAPHQTSHGLLVEVYGIGILLNGHSGVGKSETALELIKKGHRLISDDAVDFKHIDGMLIGESPYITNGMLEVRGLGIIDIIALYGLSSVLERKKLDLIIQLEHWNDNEFYDRLGNVELYEEILNVPIKMIKIPIRPGRNTSVLVEAAAANYRYMLTGKPNAIDIIGNRILKITENNDN